MRGAAELVKKIFDKPVIVAEMGVEKGLNASEMLSNMNVEKLYLIDDYAPYTDYLGGFCPPEIQEEVYQTMFKNLNRYLDKIVFITRNSVQAGKLFPDEFFDFVYIDGNHNYDSVLQDLNIWYHKIKKGGVLGGHDFDIRNIDRQDVTEAVKDFTKLNELEFQVFSEGVQPRFSDWVIIR
jgi:hypothetical protein